MDGRCRLNRRQNRPQSASGWLAGLGVTDYGNTRFFGRSNNESSSPQRTRWTQRNSLILRILCVPVYSAVESLNLSSELHGHSRTGYNMSSSCRGLLAGQAAADGFQVEANILRSFHGASNRLSDEGRNFDAALLDIEHHSSCRWQFFFVNRHCCLGWCLVYAA
jgi:hypothetical protein